MNYSEWKDCFKISGHFKKRKKEWYLIIHAFRAYLPLSRSGLPWGRANTSPKLKSMIIQVS